MKLVILCLLVSFSLCIEKRYFRYNNGTFIKGNKSSITISGSFYTTEYQGVIEIRFFGMDYSTMTPLYFYADDYYKIGTGIKIELDCLWAQHGLENSESDLSGTSVLKGSWDKPEFSAQCYTRAGDSWVIKSSSVKSQTRFYSQKEAGYRAKFLIDQPASKYEPPNIISFALADYPYFNLRCESLFDPAFLDVPGPEPGAIIAGKDKKHCAILDDEGTKFIQSNPIVGKVTYDSIAIVQRYFPNGVAYKIFSGEELEGLLR